MCLKGDIVRISMETFEFQISICSVFNEKKHTLTLSEEIFKMKNSLFDFNATIQMKEWRAHDKLNGWKI